MKIEILKCPKCNIYTLKTTCPKCKLETLTPKPARFSIKDNLSKYRLRIKQKSKYSS